MNSLQPPPEPDLRHGRSNAMIKFVIRNLIATNASLHRAIFPEVSEATAQKLISKMIKPGLFQRHFFCGSKSYLRLGPAAASRWPQLARLTRRLGPQVLPYLWGVHSLCTKSDPPLQRLMPHELQAMHEGFPGTRDLQQWAFYESASEGDSRLGMIRVEYRASAATVITKLAQQLHRYREHKTLARLLADGRFFVHIVTATPEQESSLWEDADRLGLGVELRTCHDPSLTMFL